MQQEDTEKEYVSTQVSVLDCKFQLLENNIQSTNIGTTIT